MKIRLTNEIQIDQEMEVIDQEFEVKETSKNGWTYLIFHNEEDEQVTLKFNQTELTMTRFSQPKSTMRFVKGQEAVLALPTPVGFQHLVTATEAYRYQPTLRTLDLAYRLSPLDSDQVFGHYKMKITWE